MGKYKFWLSGGINMMIPTAWFYKLKHISSSRKNRSNNNKLKSQLHGFHNSTLLNQSISGGTHFQEPARKSSNKTSTRRRTIYKPSSPRFVLKNPALSPTSICHHASSNSFGPFPHSPHSSFENAFSSDSFDDDLASWSSSCNKCRSSINDVNGELFERKTDTLHRLQADQLPPMLRTTNVRSSYKWREMKANHYVEKVKEDIRSNVEKQRTSVGARKSTTSTISVKLRADSPRIGRRRARARARRNVASGIGLEKSKNSCVMDSVVMVKTSSNPREDFKESMVEMIIVNNIWKSKDLEDLLACYLVLNSDEYHELIIKTFEQIWFDMAELQI